MNRLILPALLAVGLLGLGAPARTVSGDTVVSQRDPRVTVRVPDTAQYAGTDEFVLYGIANCRIFAFVDADQRKNVRALYWVQFEGYIPSMPKLHHQYNSPHHVTMGGLDFYVDTWTESFAGTPKPPDLSELKAFIRKKGYALPQHMNSGSDEQHILALLKQHGYKPPAPMQSVRFVHTLDDARKELMLIYSEPLPTASHTLDKTLIRRAQQKITIASL